MTDTKLDGLIAAWEIVLGAIRNGCPDLIMERIDAAIAAERKSAEGRETVDAEGNFDWTPELEAARISLCQFWVRIADDIEEGAVRFPELGHKAIETEQALTLLGDIALRSRPDAESGKGAFSEGVESMRKAAIWECECAMPTTQDMASTQLCDALERVCEKIRTAEPKQAQK